MTDVSAGRTCQHRFVLAAFVTLVTATACDIPPDLTLTPTEAPITIIPPSLTVAPLAPTARNLDSSNLGVQDFTPGAPALSAGNPAVTVTPTPAPTEATIPVTFITSDGLAIVGIYYGAPFRPAPTVLLLHMAGGTKETWRLFAAQLQVAGHNVLAIDLRGHGETGGKVDWARTPADIATVLTRLRALPGVDSERLSVVGADIGANLALVACAETQFCKALVLISPVLDDAAIRTAEAAPRLGPHPVLIIASRDDKPSAAGSQALQKLLQSPASSQVRIFEGTVHGLALLNTQPQLRAEIVEWLTTR